MTLYAKFIPLYTVEYVWAGSEEVAAVTVREGELIEAPDITAAPEDIQAQYDCRYQVYWFVDDALTEQYDFETEIADNLTLYAGYEIRPEMRWFTDTSLSAYTLITADELQSLSVLTAGGYSFEGVTIYLGESRDDEVGEITEGVLDLSAINWTPIGNAEYPFAGTFDGGIYGADADGELGLDDCYTLNGVSISNYAEYEYAGLFGYVTGTIRNVAVSGLVYVTADYAGGIVGWLDGTITNCCNDATVYNQSADGVTGGIAGYVNGAVYSCTNSSARIYSRETGNNITGGIVGIANCFVTDSINSGRYVMGKGIAAGGITGLLKSGYSIERCISEKCQVSNSADSGVGGGITGEMEETTSLCFCGNGGSVVATAAAGGIVGSLDGSGTIESCYNTGDVTYGKSSRGGGILGYSQAGYDDVLILCCNLSTQSGTWADADYVTATTDPAEAAYIMDNGGSERYEKWGWADGDSTPVLVSNGATPVYKLKLTAVKSKIEALTRNYFTAGETVTLYAAKTLEEGDVWVINGISDYDVSEDGSSVSFVMPANDVSLSATITNPDKGYTVTFLLHDGDDWEDEDNLYDEQTVMGGDLAVRPEEQDDADDLGTIYAYYNDAGEFRGYYIFLGWYLDEDGELAEEEYDFELLVSEDMILYAQWAIVTIQFNLNGVDCTTSVPASYETGVGVTLPEPTPEPSPKDDEENTLRGWSTTQKPAPGDETDALWVFDTSDTAEAAAVSEDDSDDDSESDDDEAGDDTPTVLTEDLVSDGMTVTMYAIWADSVYNWAVTYGVSGSGTESDPFVITTDEQLNSMASLMGDNEDVSLEGYYFQLSADGDNGGQFKLTESIVPSHDYSYDATEDDYVHTYGEYFQGVFDGGSEDGCTIDISEAELGLFGIVGEYGIVRNCEISGNISMPFISESSSYYFTVSDSADSTDVPCFGSVASVNYGLVEVCGYSGSISCSDSLVSMGGIVGCISDNGIVCDCSVNGLAMSDGRMIGGITGSIKGSGNSDSSIKNCTVTNSQIGDGESVGAGGVVGLVGNFQTYSIDIVNSTGGIDWIIDNCLVEDNCEISGGIYTGGIVGSGKNLSIINCKNYASISGNSYLQGTSDDSHTGYTGGIVGILTAGNLSNCENYGDVVSKVGATAGGIAGTILQVLSGGEEGVYSCKNYGIIKSSLALFLNAGFQLESLRAVGGIIGSIGLGSDEFSISGCENIGNIEVESDETTGGIVGCILDWRYIYSATRTCTPCTVTIENCKQSGELLSSVAESGTTGTYRVVSVGGVLGSTVDILKHNNSNFTTYISPVINISGCEVSSPIVAGGVNSENIGGIIGISESSSVTIDNTTLSGDSSITVEATGDASNIGYIAGSSASTVLSGVKLGGTEINVTAEGTASYIGGVSGEITISENVLEELNRGNLTISVTAPTVTNVGGIAGKITVGTDDEDDDGSSGSETLTLDFGDISDISVEIEGDGSYIGGIAGTMAGKVKFSALCEDVSIEISGTGSYTGGIIGAFEDVNNSILTYGGFAGDIVISGIENEPLVGGLIGYGDVEYSYYRGGFDCGGNDYGVGLLTGGGSTTGVTASYFYGDENVSAGNGISGDGTANVTASYYLGTSDSGQSKTAEQFASGEVAWLMETLDANSECLGTNHIYVWTQGMDYPEWSYGGSTVNRVRAQASPTEGGTVTLNDSSEAGEAVYVVSGEQVTVTATPSTELFDYSEDEDGSASWNEYIVKEIVAAVDAGDESGTELSSSESATLSFSVDADSIVTATFIKELHEVAGQKQSDGEGDGEGDDEGDGSGTGDEDATGDNGDGGEDGSGRSGSDSESSGSIAPSADGELTDEYIYNDSSDEFQMEESLGAEAPEGGAEVEETVEGPETEAVAEPEPEPEPELEEIEEVVEPEQHVFELTAIVTAIKENPLMTVIVVAAVVGVFVAGIIMQYRKYRRDFSESAQ
ncbi:MAG: InlB B-repeat-containing protein [Clostridiales bacterium]|nr:InlB B-repeat-containing protein [Clostridiales bacterium]